ncbi:MAG: GGDEF domain-containing protein [Atopobiaceae bacterium]|jgi:diguanylate cyclase (GGDEF)-like protein|nr:GGDEF domain-containing protein [Atopobiaceae bacterium]
MYLAVYAETTVICIAMLSVLLYRGAHKVDKQAANVAFIQVVQSVIALLALSFACVAARGTSLALVVCLEIAYMSWSIVACALWLRFVEAQLDHPRRTGRAAVPVALPLAVGLVMVFGSISTGWVFSVDDALVAHPGSLQVVFNLLCLFYPSLASEEVVVRLMGERSRQRRTAWLGLLSVFALLLAGVILRFAFPELPCIWPSFSIALLIVFCNRQEASISTDELTGLNNRRRFDAELQRLSSAPGPRGHVFMLMIDLDRFKRINDGFGHPEGDQALIETAGILKRSVGKTNSFLARLGGDEFAVLCRSLDEDGVEALRADIAEAFYEWNKTSDKPYKLDVSIGVGELSRDHSMTVEELVQEADANMYGAKERAHRRRA